MSKLVCHMGKYTRGNVFGLQKHNQRENKNYSNTNIDKQKLDLNYDFENKININYLDKIDMIIKKYRSNTKKAVRKDAIVFIDTIISSDNEFFKNLTENETKSFFKYSYKYLSNKIGKNNIISAVVHMDEYTPHMHFNFVPINQDGSLSAKKMINRNFLRNIQSELPQYLKDKGFNIERGMENSLLRHLEPLEYKKNQIKKDMINIEKKEKDIIKKFKELENQATSVCKLSKHMDNVIGQIYKIKPKKTLLGGKITITEDEYNLLLKLARDGESKLIENIRLNDKVKMLTDKIEKGSLDIKLKYAKINNYEEILKENIRLNKSIKIIDKALDNLGLLTQVTSEIKRIINHKENHKEKSR